MFRSWSYSDSIDDLYHEIEEQKKKVEEIPDHYHRIRLDEEQRLHDLENRLRLERQGRP